MINKIFVYVGTSDSPRLRDFAVKGWVCNKLLVDTVYPKNKIINALCWNTGYWITKPRIGRWLRQHSEAFINADIIWIECGELLDKKHVKSIRAWTSGKIILYSSDDISGTRDRARFALARAALSEYDLCITQRAEAVLELKALGAKKVVRLFHSMSLSDSEKCTVQISSEREKSSIVFVGTNIPGENRFGFIKEIAKSGIKADIYGNKWTRLQANQLARMGVTIHGKSIERDEYYAVLEGSLICLGLLSNRNRDGHTSRSFEVPYSGCLFLGVRTAEHELLYEDGCEAIFWETIEECKLYINELITNPDKAKRIAINGKMAARRIMCTYQELLRTSIKIVTNYREPENYSTKQIDRYHRRDCAE